MDIWEITSSHKQKVTSWSLNVNMLWAYIGSHADAHKDSNTEKYSKWGKIPMHSQQTVYMIEM